MLYIIGIGLCDSLSLHYVQANPGESWQYHSRQARMARGC